MFSRFLFDITEATSLAAGGDGDARSAGERVDRPSKRRASPHNRARTGGHHLAVLVFPVPFVDPPGNQGGKGPRKSIGRSVTAQ
jgi:hypothetical protein